MDPIRLLIVDDHEVVRKGLRSIIGLEPEIEILGEANNGEEAIHKINALQPTLVLMDLILPRINGINIIKEIKRISPHIRVLVFTGFQDKDKVEAALEAGADGYLLKDVGVEVILEAIKSAQRGDMPLDPRVARHLFAELKKPITDENETSLLTEREREVLRLVARGLSNKDIGQMMNLSEATIKVHVSNILEKLNASSRTEAAFLAVQTGLLPPNRMS